jgi:hypothetical protein
MRIKNRHNSRESIMRRWVGWSYISLLSVSKKKFLLASMKSLPYCENPSCTLFRKLFPAFRSPPCGSKKFLQKLPIRNPEKLFRKPVMTCKSTYEGEKKLLQKFWGCCRNNVLELLSVFKEISIIFLFFSLTRQPRN